MTKTKWRDGQDDAENEKVGRANLAPSDGKTLTIQSGKDDADINVLVRRFGLGEGPLAPPPFNPDHYGDFTNIPTTLPEVYAIRRQAEQNFEALPARLREKFDNDPAKLWTYVNDERNWEQAVELGLLQKREPPTTFKEHPNKEDTTDGGRIRKPQESTTTEGRTPAKDAGGDGKAARGARENS